MKNKIEIYLQKEYLFYGQMVEARKDISAKIAAEEILDSCEIEYYDIEEAIFIQESKNDSLGLRVKISVKKTPPISHK